MLALKNSNLNYNSLTTLTTDSIKDLQWWEKAIKTACNDIRFDQFDIEIFTDASRTGWGAYTSSNNVTNGYWSEEDQKRHINFLEIKAIFFGLQCFTKESRNINVLIRTDNMTALTYINRMGGVQFPYLNVLARYIWQWCEERNIWLVASYIQSKLNMEADKASRIISEEAEWCLDQKYFDHIVSNLGMPEIDLFASKANHKCVKYFSWKKDPGSFGSDAFTFDWSKDFFYAFTPFSMILRVIRKIVSDGATGILVVPYWPTQPWFPLFQKLQIKQIILKPSSTMLYSPFRKQHPLQRDLFLVAALLSGKL